MQREIIKFDIDRPQVVRLDLSEGKEVTSKAGSKQWQYTVDRNQGIMWLPLAGRQAIERCGAQAGDQVKILKTLLGKQTVFTAQVIPDEPQKPATLAVPALRANGHLPASVYYQPEGNQQPAPPFVSEPVQKVHPIEALYARCLATAARQNWVQWEEARKQGYDYEAPIWEDVRMSANTLFINVQQGGK